MLSFAIAALLCLASNPNTKTLGAPLSQPTDLVVENCPTGLPFSWPCLTVGDGRPATLRVLYIEKPFVVSNPAAKKKVESLGRKYIQSCDDPTLAVPECFEFENWKGGWIGSYMYRALKDLNLNVVAMTKANFSEAAMQMNTDSSSTRCVWDLKLGNVDMCIGSYWETPERKNLTAFTSAIDSDSFVLVTQLNSSAVEQGSNIWAIFSPFANSVWLLCVLGIGFCTVALEMVERRRDAKSVVEMLTNQLDAVYDVTMSFLGAEDEILDNRNSWPARIISIGIGLFVFAHVLSYNGSLAAYYVSLTSVQLGNVNNLQDVKASGEKLCVYLSMSDAVYPMISDIIPRSRLLPMSGYGPMLEKLRAGECIAAIVGRQEAYFYLRASNVNFTVCKDPQDSKNMGTCTDKSKQPVSFFLNPDTCPDKECQYARRYCDLVQLEDDVVSKITLSFSMPVRKDFEPMVSYSITRLHSKGQLKKSLFNEVDSKNPTKCAGPAPPSQSVQLNQIAGTFFFCGLLTAIGIVVQGFSYCFGSRPAENKGQLSSAGPSQLESAAAANGLVRGAKDPLDRQWQTTLAEFSKLLSLAQGLSRKADESYRFVTIADRFRSLEEVQQGLREAGLESSNLIIGVDFTGSNQVTGRVSFGGRCLHDTTGPPNPYQQVMEIAGRTLESFDDDHLIPAFGFGDERTRDKSCFPFHTDGRPCRGLQEVLSRYKEIAPEIALCGPTNFAPIIDKAIEILVAAGRSYHILLIIGDGQVTNEEETKAAIVRASAYPLSIIMVGVGDGPWEMMHKFDDELPERRFDNFQFVEQNRLRADIQDLERKYKDPFGQSHADAYFAMQMLMEVPDQFLAIRKLKLLE